MLFKDFAFYLEKLEKTTSRNKMTEILADLFKKASLEEIDKICYLSLGRLVPKFVGLEFQMAEKMIIRAIALAYDLPQGKVKKKYKRMGDLGEVTFQLATKKSSDWEDLGGPTEVGSNLDSHLLNRIPQEKKIVKSPNIKRVELAGFAPAEPWVRIQVPYSSSPTRNLSYQKNKLNVNQVYEKLMKIAEESGEGSVERKINGLGELLRQLEPLSAKYVVRIPLGKLRLGFSDMTILDAFSWLVKGDKSGREELEKAYYVRPDVGELAGKVKKAGLAGAVGEVKPRLGVPILPMLAQRLKSPAEMIEKMGKVAVEPKFDGLRVQIHAWHDRTILRNYDIKKYKNIAISQYRNIEVRVEIFSRNLENVTHMFPEVVDAAKKLVSGVKCQVSSVILDGEAAGVDSKSGKFLPFQETTKRKRKHGILAMAKKIPVKVFLFDILFLNGESLMEKNYLERRKVLEKMVEAYSNTPVLQGAYSNTPVLQIVDYQLTQDPKEIGRLNLENRRKGLEGIIVKKLTSGYVPGRTGWRWVKMKEGEEAVGKLPDTLDCVVMGYSLGKGKRTQFGLGQFLAGVVDDEKIKTITRVGTGLSDEEFRDLKKRLQRLRVRNKPKEYLVDKNQLPDFWVASSLVVELAGDDLTKSPSHTSGYALRFPRLVAFREDKSPNEATTLEEVRRLFHL